MGVGLDALCQERAAARREVTVDGNNPGTAAPVWRLQACAGVAVHDYRLQRTVHQGLPDLLLREDARPNMGAARRPVCGLLRFDGAQNHDGRLDTVHLSLRDRWANTTWNNTSCASITWAHTSFANTT